MPIVVERLSNKDGFRVEGTVQREEWKSTSLRRSLGGGSGPAMEKRNVKFRVQDDSADAWVAAIKRAFSQ